MLVIARVSQIVTILRAGSTGELAFITSFLNTIGSAARVFTTIQEVDDKMILLSFITGVILNTVITLLVSRGCTGTGSWTVLVVGLRRSPLTASPPLHFLFFALVRDFPLPLFVHSPLQFVVYWNADAKKAKEVKKNK